MIPIFFFCPFLFSAVNGFGELLNKPTFGANPSLLNSKGAYGGRTDGAVYPAMYPKPDYAIEKYVSIVTI